MSRRLVLVLSLAIATLAVVVTNAMGWGTLSKLALFVVTFALVYFGASKMQSGTPS
jgi:hypothetical protein